MAEFTQSGQYIRTSGTGIDFLDKKPMVASYAQIEDEDRKIADPRASHDDEIFRNMQPLVQSGQIRQGQSFQVEDSSNRIWREEEKRKF